MSATDFLTPEWLLELVRRVSLTGTIGLDPCTFPDNPTKAAHFFTKEDNGLLHDWADYGLVFVNEPYGRKESPVWSRKIAQEARSGTEMVRLTRGSFDTEWWSYSVAQVADSMCLLRGRPRHDTPTTKASGPGKFPSAVIGYGLPHRRFAEVFAAHGQVVRC